MDGPKDEKPQEEKCIFDQQIKDHATSQFYFLYYSGLIHFISIFALPLSQDVAFWISFIGIFLLYFNVVSALVCLYIEYIFVFQPDDTKNLEPASLRWKSLTCKLSLSIVMFLIDVLFPFQELVILQLLTKSNNNDRYLQLCRLEMASLLIKYY